MLKKIKLKDGITPEQAGFVKPEYAPGVILSAEIMTGGKYGSDKRYDTTYGTKTVRGVAAIIDRHTVATELLELAEAFQSWLLDDSKSQRRKNECLSSCEKIISKAREGVK